MGVLCNLPYGINRTARVNKMTTKKHCHTAVLFCCGPFPSTRLSSSTAVYVGTPSPFYLLYAVGTCMS